MNCDRSGIGLSGVAHRFLESHLFQEQVVRDLPALGLSENKITTNS
jgi:hypothetical protein